MAFKTKEEMFGDGGGFGPVVPYSVSNPPGTFAGNRGIQFGEQLTAAIANRSHYALALNDEDLNTRLAIFETQGLDAAYDNGTVGPAGGGREIIKDGGAVETQSILTAPGFYADPANAHFRAKAVTDTVRGGGGFDFVAVSRLAALNSALYGYLDRRTTDFITDTVVTGIVAVSLNDVGVQADGCTLTGPGVFRTGANTDLALGLDLLEVMAPSPYAGLYIILNLPTANRATLRKLDGTAPGFAASSAASAQVYRATFGSFSPFAGTAFSGTTLLGMPEQSAVLNLVPGGVYARYGTASPGGARKAIQISRRLATGSLSPILSIDGLGQILGTADSSMLAVADRRAGIDFGASTLLVTHPGTNPYDTGVVVRSAALGGNHFGVVASEPMVGPPATFDDSIDFTFIAPAGTIDLGQSLTNPEGIYAADHNIVTGFLSVVEIFGSAASDGIYLVQSRAVGTGVLILRDLGGSALGTFPTSGSAKCKLLTIADIGSRVVLVEGPANGAGSATRATATFGAPGAVDSAALILHASKFVPQHFLRCIAAESGVGKETIQLRSDGEIYSESYVAGSGDIEAAAGDIEATVGDFRAVAGNFRYVPSRSKKFLVSIFEAIQGFAGGSGWNKPSSPSADHYWVASAATEFLAIPLNAYLRDGMQITDVAVQVEPATSILLGANRMRIGLAYTEPDMVTPVPVAVSPVVVQEIADSGTLGIQNRFFGAFSHAVVREGVSARDYFVYIRSSTTGVGDRFYALELTVNDPGPRNF